MHAHPTRATRLSLVAAFVALAALFVVLPHGEMAPMGEVRWDPVARTAVFVHDHGRMMWHGLANAAGGVATLLTLATMGLPYLRRPIATRVHVWAGLAILVLAASHTSIYLADGSTRGWIPGAVSLLLFGVHGATGALKAALVRHWGAAWWRLVHGGSGWGALAMVVEHILLASWHFGFARYFD